MCSPSALFLSNSLLSLSLSLSHSLSIHPFFHYGKKRVMDFLRLDLNCKVRVYERLLLFQPPPPPYNQQHLLYTTPFTHAFEFLTTLFLFCIASAILSPHTTAYTLMCWLKLEIPLDCGRSLYSASAILLTLPCETSE